jgi:squalene-hopene/tetraprenyl-beta-curcumene cyclase
MTYAGLKSMIYAGLDADDPRVLAAVDWAGDNWTLDRNPGMAAGDPERDQWGLFYYYLMVARALDAFDEPTLDTPDGDVDWRLALIDALAARQADDGSWSGNPKWRENDPTMVTAYSVIALNAALNDLRENPPE